MDESRKVFDLFHYKISLQEEPSDRIEADHEKSIGAFSSREKAEAAAEFLRTKPGFKEWPHGFRITYTIVDEIAWKTGFFTHESEDGRGDDVPYFIAEAPSEDEAEKKPSIPS
jgi:hypothetical protein